MDNLDDEHIEKFFMDRDFKNRTVLKIIIDNRFWPLLSSEKINILIEEIWVGKKTYECDGKLTDFSLLHYIANYKIRKLPGKKVNPLDLLSLSFKPNIKDESYWYQYDVRRYSIKNIFYKEILCAAFTALIFQLFNYQYLILFC